MAFLLDARTGEVRPVERVTHASIAWEQIPEQTKCICGHPKAEHNQRVFMRALKVGERVCHAVSVRCPIRDAMRCRCNVFDDVDARIGYGNFFDRLLLEFSEGGHVPPLDRAGEPEVLDAPNEKARAWTALWWAWRQSGLDFEARRPWYGWLHDSKRVWHAWREAGSPIVAFGKQVSFGVCSIPVLEDR